MSKMKFSHGIAFLCVSICIQGCVGSAFLKRGQKDNKGYRTTPWLCDVPDKPKPISFEERQKLKNKLEVDYDKEITEIKILDN